MIGIFRPAPHQERLPDDKINDEYKSLRWKVFLGIFIGYAGYYLVRKNFSLAMPFLIEEQGRTWHSAFRSVNCLWLK
jgi:OPA family glycerol-3-phosphate transporter-like MFS transporter